MFYTHRAAALAAAVSVAVAACGQAPSAPVPSSSASSPPAPPARPQSQVIHVLFPAGSTLQPSDNPSPADVPPNAETWIVPLAVADEIADLRVQLPIGLPWGDGRPWCSEHSLPTVGPGSVQWSWGTPQADPIRGKFLAVSVMAGGVNTSKVDIIADLMNPDPGCP